MGIDPDFDPGISAEGYQSPVAGARESRSNSAMAPWQALAVPGRYVEFSLEALKNGADIFSLTAHEGMHDTLLQGTTFGLLNSVVASFKDDLGLTQGDALLQQIVRSSFEVQEGCATTASWVMNRSRGGLSFARFTDTLPPAYQVAARRFAWAAKLDERTAYELVMLTGAMSLGTKIPWDWERSGLSDAAGLRAYLREPEHNPTLRMRAACAALAAMTPAAAERITTSEVAEDQEGRFRSALAAHGMNVHWKSLVTEMTHDESDEAARNIVKGLCGGALTASILQELEKWFTWRRFTFETELATRIVIRKTNYHYDSEIDDVQDLRNYSLVRLVVMPEKNRSRSVGWARETAGLSPGDAFMYFNSPGKPNKAGAWSSDWIRKFASHFYAGRTVVIDSDGYDFEAADVGLDRPLFRSFPHIVNYKFSPAELAMRYDRSDRAPRWAIAPSNHPGVSYLLARPSLHSLVVCPMSSYAQSDIGRLLSRNSGNVPLDWRTVAGPFTRDLLRWIHEFDDVPWPADIR